MGSGVIFYKYEKREKFEDHDMRSDAELGTFKIRRYHFDNKSFVHPLHSVRFDPDRPYEFSIEALMDDKIASASKSEESSSERRRSSRRHSPRYSPRTMPVAQRERPTSSVKGTRSFRRGTASGSVRKPRSWELIPPSGGWMCDADDEKEIGGMDPSDKGESSEEDPEMEEEYPEEAGNPEDRIPATPSLPMDIDAEEDFQRYVEELGRSKLRRIRHLAAEVYESESLECLACREICYSLVSRVCKDKGCLMWYNNMYYLGIPPWGRNRYICESCLFILLTYDVDALTLFTTGCNIVLLGPLFFVGTIPTSPWYYLYDSVHLPRSERIMFLAPLPGNN
ncbi:hypothetical protein PIB30_067303 [Stylosanthes scabra]|uniref:Uncharacterized protein n=1 Tax=Stylosanthes scabra TaxID=79078 RepID=A0ABU6WKT9_9FABA|nr:hypothetical protein [Stylosanthes scabra]